MDASKNGKTPASIIVGFGKATVAKTNVGAG